MTYQYLINNDVQYTKDFVKNCFEEQKINFRIPLVGFKSNIANLKNQVTRKIKNNQSTNRFIPFLNKHQKIIKVLELILKNQIYFIEEESPYKAKHEKKKGKII